MNRKILQEQNIFVEVSELAPVGTLITSLGDAHSKDSVRFLLAGESDDKVHFMVEPGNGNVLIQKQLDREKSDHHLLRIEVKLSHQGAKHLLINSGPFPGQHSRQTIVCDECACTGVGCQRQCAPIHGTFPVAVEHSP